MREIKFRAWDKKKKKMVNDVTVKGVYQSKIYLSTWYVEVIRDFDEFGEPIYFDPNCVEVMQYTGLEDKNGKKIYEGDILADNSDEKYICEWGEPEAGFYLYQISSARTFYFPDFKENELRIVGNIHENPELLEEGGYKNAKN